MDLTTLALAKKAGGNAKPLVRAFSLGPLGEVYSDQPGLIEGVNAYLHSNAAPSEIVTAIQSAVISKEKLYLNEKNYPLEKMEMNGTGILFFNVTFKETDAELGCGINDPTLPCFGIVLTDEPEAESGYVLIVASSEPIRNKTWHVMHEGAYATIDDVVDLLKSHNLI